MRKVIVIIVIIIFNLSVFTSCDTSDEMEEIYGIEQGDQNQQKADTGREALGDNQEEPEEETGE